MRRLLLAVIFVLAALPACAEDDIVLRQMGSFHIGGGWSRSAASRCARSCSRRGVPARFDPNGPYQVEQMYVQYSCQRTARASCRS